MGREESLLGELAVRLARSPEDIATEALVYILSRSKSVRMQVQRFAQDVAPQPLRPVVSFRSQVTAEDDCRPDVEGHDTDGVPVVILENKFWAGLTDAQPMSYLRRLEDRGGVLSVVAPSLRLGLLWPELVQRVEAAAIGDISHPHSEQELKVAHVGGNRTLALISWSFLLGQIRNALEAEGDLALIADLRQLEGLASRMETGGFIPFTLGDLTSPTPRHVVQFCDVVDSAVATLLREPWADKKKLKATAGSGWYGHYLRVHDQGCQLSFNARMWNEYGRSPIWLWVRSPAFKYSEKLERALVNHFGHEACITLRGEWREGCWLAVRVAEGCERDAVVSDICRQVAEVAEVLAGVGHGEEPATAPPDAEEDEASS